MVFSGLIVVFFVLALYNFPIVMTGAWRFLRKRKETGKHVGSGEENLSTVSVIVPVKNEEKVVGRLLDALLSLDYPAGRKEIVVVDDASTDRTREICLEYASAHSEVTVLKKTESTTKAGALNFGLHHAHGEIVATFDGDSVPEADALLKVAKYFRDSSVAAVQGRIYSINSGQNMLTRFISHESAIQYELYMQGKDALGLYVGLAGTCQFIRREALEAIGGWNENCLVEDTELSLRLVERGNAIRYAPDVRTFEESPCDVKGLMAQRSRWYRGNMEVGLKFGRLMKKPDWRKFDAEMTLFSTFLILLCVLNYFAPLWAFSVPSTLILTVIVQFTSLFTLLALAFAGIALASMSKPLRLRNMLWLPFIYAYWGFQSFIALYALFEIVLRRKRLWRKTEHSGQVSGTSEAR